MNSKKAITLLVLATLLVSMVPVLPVSAISAPSLWVDDGSAAVAAGVYGDTILVNGTGVTSGNTINIYWDTVGAAYLLNSTTGNPDGSFEVLVDVPSAKAGNHYIWVKDMDTQQTSKSAAFAVNRKITLSVDEGLADDTVTVKGYGYASAVDCNIWFSNATVNINATTSFVESSSLGAWTLSFEVPGPATNWTYGAYTVSGVQNVTGDLATATFTIGPAITISKSEGPAGTVVSVSGRGFAGTTELYESNFTLDGTQMAFDDDENVTTTALGAFTHSVIVPSLAAGDYTLQVSDGVNVATADFEVLGNSEVMASPGHGAPGETVTVSGYNFTQIAGTHVDVWVGAEKVASDVDLDANGEFTVDVILPALTLNQQHDVMAVDDNGLNDTAAGEVLIGVVTMLLSDYSGDVGDKISLTATGLKGTSTYNISIGDVLVYESEAYGAVTAIAKDLYIPDLAAGVYPITLTDGGWDITVSLDFTVVGENTLTLSPGNGPNGYNITVSADSWIEKAAGAIEWDLYNSTDLWDLNVLHKTTGVAITTNASGYFEAYFVVPAGLDLGSYTINATVLKGVAGQDAGNWYLEVPFEVTAEEWDISIKKAEYMVGETISYNIRATFEKAGAELTITDPDGYLYWFATFGAGDWVAVGDWETVPVGYQISDAAEPFTLAEDAPLGTWTWMIEDAAGDELESGTFEVVAWSNAEVEAAMEEIVAGLNEEIAALADEIVDYSGDFDALSDEFADLRSAVAAAEDAADAATEAVNAVAQTANTASQAAENAAEAAEAARDAASSLSTLVYGAIGAALVAALAAIVSLMQISRRIAG